MEWITVIRGLWTWQVRSTAALELIDSLPPIETQVDQLPDNVQIVKLGASRRVLRIDDDALGGSVYCKDFQTVSQVDRLRTWVRGTPAEWEASRIRLAEDRGIPTAELLAVGVEKSPHARSNSRVVTRAIEDVRPLSGWRPPFELPVAPSQATLIDRTGCLQTLAQLVAELHAAGLWHGDLHSGNVLLRHDGTNWQSWLIDLAALRTSKRVPRQRVIENLGRFWLSLDRLFTSEDRTRFLGHYYERLQALNPQLLQYFGETSETAVGEIEASTLPVVEALQRSADNAWQRGNRKVTIAVDGRFLSSLGSAWWQKFVSDLPELWSSTAPTWNFDALASRRIIRTTPFGEQTLRFWRWETLTRSRSFTPARAAWETGHALLRRSVPVAVPWGIVERGRSECWLITCEPTGLVELDSTDVESTNEIERLSQQLGAARYSVEGNARLSLAHSRSASWTGWWNLPALRRWT